MIQSTQRGLVNMMQRLVEWVKQIEMTSQKIPVPRVQPSTATKEEPSQPSGLSSMLLLWPARSLCQRVCSTKTDSPHEAPKNNHPIEPNVPPTYSINNVSSYLLSCSIYNSPVSFLIDMGMDWGVITEHISVGQDKTSQRKV